MSTLPQLEKASRLVARAAAVFIEELELIEQSGCDVDVAALWAALEEVAPRAALSSAAATVVSLVPEDDDTAEAALRGAHGITSGPLFRHITRGGTIRPRSVPRGDFLSPDAIKTDADRVTDRWVSRVVAAGANSPRPPPNHLTVIRGGRLSTRGCTHQAMPLQTMVNLVHSAGSSASRPRSVGASSLYLPLKVILL
nr:hypothetical protein [Streptomyces capillispiralis]